jgi:hypothetical protein
MNRSTYGPETTTQSLNRVHSEASILFSLPIYSDHFSSCCQFRPLVTFRHSCPYGPHAANPHAPAPPRGSPHEHSPGRRRSSPDGPGSRWAGPKAQTVSEARMPHAGCRTWLARVPAKIDRLEDRHESLWASFVPSCLCGWH